MSVRILVGDCRESMAQLEAKSVQCCVTSPPYYGLRSYLPDGHADKHLEIGLESTPQEYVDRMVGVFREVRRVLKDDGTLWLNIGDSYSNAGTRQGDRDGAIVDLRNEHRMVGSGYRSRVEGLKNKDLIGIPWALATALRNPYYTGEIKAERDRVWLAATIDAEGCISGYRHERKDDGRIRTGVNVTITNTSTVLLDEATRIWPASRHDHMSGARLGSRPVYRWISTGVDRNSMLMRELYPYLIVKRRQALLAYNLFELSRVAKRDGQTLEGTNSRAKRDALVAAISQLNQGENADVPSWCIEPPSPTEPGFYLRSDVIWAKPNPMPESVTDRPTKSHEYLFLLSKSERYFYDADGIAERCETPPQTRDRSAEGYGVALGDGRDRFSAGARTYGLNGTRNKRSVWTVNTLPYSGAHFATFPPALIEPCIKAGSSDKCCEFCGKCYERQTEKAPPKEGIERGKHPSAHRANLHGAQQSANGGLGTREVFTLGFSPACDCGSVSPVPSTILDPFGGAGTTGLVADRLNRNAILCELNPEYAELARNRIYSDNPLFTDVA